MTALVGREARDGNLQTEAGGAHDSRSVGLAAADNLINVAQTADEAFVAIRIRAEILRQDREQREYEMKIWKLKSSMLRLRRRDFFDAFLQISSLATGTFLVMSSHEWIGGFVAAAGVYRIAREFVLKKFPGSDAE